MLKYLLTISVIVVCAKSASAEADGKFMLEKCASSPEFLEGFIYGAMSVALNASVHIRDQFKSADPQTRADAFTIYDGIIPYCAPSFLTSEQVIGVYCKYLKEEPDARSGRPVDLLNMALQAEWPCRR